MAVPGDDAFASLARAINDAAIGDGDFARPLALMNRAFGVEASTIEIFDKAGGEPRIFATSPLDAETTRLYAEHIHAVNPRFWLFPRTPFGAVAADRHIPEEINAPAAEFYEWLERTTCRWFAGIALLDEPDLWATSTINTTEAQGPVDLETERAYARLAPLLANALAVRRALALRDDRIAALDGEALGCGRAYALLDQSGSVIECSAAFAAAVARSGALVIRGRRLTACRSADDWRLQRMIGGAVSPDASGGVPAPLRLASEARHGWLLRAVRLTASDQWFARLRPAALLTLTDLDSPVAARAADLQAAWGLTPREAELAILIGQGRTLEQAAHALGIGEGTARHHLKSIFRRMEIDRQSDLVRLVAKLGG